MSRINPNNIYFKSTGHFFYSTFDAHQISQDGQTTLEGDAAGFNPKPNSVLSVGNEPIATTFPSSSFCGKTLIIYIFGDESLSKNKNHT